MASLGGKVLAVTVVLAVGAGAFLLWRTEPGALTTAADVEGATLDDLRADGLGASGTKETLRGPGLG